jgi:putative pyoverdin transport system ATP-binding/permease protein
MSFFRLVRREMQSSLPRLGFMSALGGISTAAILASVNAGAQSAEAGEVDLWSASLFLIAVLLFIKTQHYILIATTAESESIIHRLRVRILDQVRQSELISLDAIGRSEIIAAVTEDTATLTQAANLLAFMVQGVVLIVFVALYVAYLSIIAFVLSVVIIGSASALYHSKNHERIEGAREAAKWERLLIARMTDILEGFKEIRLNSVRSDELISAVREVSRRAANVKIYTQSESLKQLVFSQSAMYLLLGAIVFVVPTFSESMTPGSITKNAMAVLFVVGACFGVMQMVAMLAAADAAARHLEKLEKELRATIIASADGTQVARSRFETIELRDVIFRYPDRPSEPGFQIGPLNFSLKAGQLVFITGGNGSGKSTFLKVLAGLYTPAAGEIVLDGAAINESTKEIHRSLITAVFSDYHLFHRLFGIAEPEQAEIDALLRQFELEQKTRVVDGEFNTLDLSGGQRKRLALIVGLLEKRPILLLDEWTANQDTPFRRRFYQEVLPELSRSGLTMIIVTHDDYSLDELTLPARRLRMDAGRFVSLNSVENVQ